MIGGIGEDESMDGSTPATGEIGQKIGLNGKTNEVYNTDTRANLFAI